jgi:AcrR family transcriptional regulator
MATREQQRARTNRAIVEAASSLLANGSSDLSMEEIADAADVSRATIYRYFDSAADIVWRVYADQNIEPPEVTMDGVDDITDRVLLAEQIINDYLFEDPNGARSFEHATLSRTLNGTVTDADRPARRLVYIDAALAPIAADLGPHLDEVRHALALAMGSQVVPAMLDTCRLPVDEARRATRFACRTIAEAAVRLAEAAARPTKGVTELANARPAP